MDILDLTSATRKKPSPRRAGIQLVSAGDQTQGESSIMQSFVNDIKSFLGFGGVARRKTIDDAVDSAESGVSIPEKQLDEAIFHALQRMGQPRN